MICFVRCSNIREDIRLNKYVQACRDRKLDVFAITWDRLRVGRYEEFEIPLRCMLLMEGDGKICSIKYCGSSLFVITYFGGGKGIM